MMTIITIIIIIIPFTWLNWSKHFSQSSFRVHYWTYCFKVSPEEISLSAAVSQLQATLLIRGLAGLCKAFEGMKHHAINVEDFGVRNHMLKGFYMAVPLSLACPSLFSCTCPFWEGARRVITACGSLFLLHLVKVTSPQRVWFSIRVLKYWVSGCGSAPRCGTVQTVWPTNLEPYQSLWWDWCQLRAA